MADRFDQVAKAVASGSLTRRQALRRVGIGVGMGLAALVGGARSAVAATPGPPPQCTPSGGYCGVGYAPCCPGLVCSSLKPPGHATCH